MNEQDPRRLWIRLFWGTFVVDVIAFALALAFRSLPLMLLALALPAVGGVGLLWVMRGRRPGPSSSWPPPGTRI